MGYQPIILQAKREFPVSPAVLWDLLANTDQLNREIGMPHVAYGPVVVSADAFYREASARFWGLLAARWREYPFEWVRGERYAVLRVFEAGHLDVFHGGMDLRPHAEGTSVRVFAEVTPRSVIGWGVARLMGWRGVRDTLAFCERSVGLQKSGPGSLVVPPSRVSPVDRGRLDQLLAALRGASLSETLVARFARHVVAAPDREVLRMQPFALADGWGAERKEVLRLLVQAERLGVLYHTWEILCPNCRIPHAEVGSAGSLPPRVHCDLCAVEYDADLKLNVELRYSVHLSLRQARDETYCVGGPANFPHIWAQQYLLPGTERVVSVTLPNEPFRVRALRVNASCPLNPDPAGPSEVAFTYRDDGWYQMRQRFLPGTVTVRLQNETARVVVAVIEQVQWDPRALTAAQVMMLPEFRDLARVEAGPGASSRA